MRYVLFVLVVIACLAVQALISHAQPIANDMAITQLKGTDAPDTTIVELQREVATLRAARAAGDRSSTYMAWAAFISFALKVVLDRLKKIPTRDLTDKAKHAIPWVLSGLGLACAVTWKFAMGETWTNAIILGGAGPGAVIVDNLWNAFVGLITKEDDGSSSKKPPSNPTATAPALVLAMLSVFFALPSCDGPYGRRVAVDFKACMIGKIPVEVSHVAPVVEDTLQHDPAWQSSLESLGIEVGIDVVTCAIAAAVSAWSSTHAALAPPVVRGLANGRAWLTAHGVQ